MFSKLNELKVNAFREAQCTRELTAILARVLWATMTSHQLLSQSLQCDRVTINVIIGISSLKLKHDIHVYAHKGKSHV